MESPASSSSRSSSSWAKKEEDGAGGEGGGNEKVNEIGKCRFCRVPLVPPNPSRRYRTIKCTHCSEVTPVGPAPEDKKYVVCSCNALLIIDDDASIFTCTRCKKVKKAVEVAAPQEGGSLSQSTGAAGGTKGKSSSPFQSYSVGTVRKNIVYRSVSTYDVKGQNVAQSREAAGTVSPNTVSIPLEEIAAQEGVQEGIKDGVGGYDIEKVQIKMNDDQVFLVNFFAERIRPSIIKDLDSNKIWWMRLKVLLFAIYNLVISGMIVSNFLSHDFSKQFGFDNLPTWKALVLFIPYIGTFCIEWIFNKIIIYGYVLMCLWYSIFACFDEKKRAFFWNFYDMGHLLDEVMHRSFYLRIPRLQVPIYRFFNPPSNSQIESEFFFLSDVHLIILVFQHPKINFFFKFFLGYSLVVKTLGRAGCIVALIILPFNTFTVIYASETFLSFFCMVIWWLITNKRDK